MSTSLPSLDVVIPCYNEQDDIDECLRRLSAEKEIQKIIVVDNMSTDDSYKLIKQWSKRDKRIVVLQESTRGVIAARNAGVAHSTANIVARIDVDTRVTSGWAQAICRYYRDNQSIAAAMGAIEFYDLPFRRMTAFIIWLFAVIGNRGIGGTVSLYGANMSIRRTAWNDIKDTIHDEKGIMEDLSITLALVQKDLTVGYNYQALAEISGRRTRTSPRQFAIYNSQWWRTYEVYGYSSKARMIRVLVWIGNVGQCLSSFVLRFHDPKTDTFRLRHFKNSYSDRIIP